MRPVRSSLPLAVVLLTAAVAGRPARADVESGPAAGAAVPALKVFVATGRSAGKEADVAAGRKDDPTLYVFVRADAWDRPTARFLTALNDEARKAGGDAEVIAVWLTDDVDKAKDYLPKADQSLQLGRTTFAVHPGDAAGPADWHVGGGAAVTVVTARGGKVAAAAGFKSVNEKDAPAAAAKLTAKG